MTDAVPESPQAPALTGEQAQIASDIAAISRISAVPAILNILCQATGMGFAAVARVTDNDWTACAVQDNIGFGLKAGGQLDVKTTLCSESRAARAPVVIDDAGSDPIYRDHHTPRIYGIKSYISVPIVLQDGQYFGNLCAIDPHPHRVSGAETVNVFNRFAELISMQLASEAAHDTAETLLAQERATAELREHFIAVLGHDLRNPLSSIGMAAEILVRRPNDPGLVTLGERLRASTRRMSKLIENLLDLARTRLGAGVVLDMSPEPDLGKLLDDVVSELKSSNPGREISSDISIAQPVLCDAARLQQLLSNLLANAVSYGDPQRPIKVRVRHSADVLELSVHNWGEPVPAESQGKVFQPYWRPASSEYGGGLGLGLYICSEIVKAYDGGMSVTSSLEKGTLFSAQLPVPAA